MNNSILMLEHDDDDRYITKAVFEENRYPVTLHFADNSTDFFAHLLSCEKSLFPFPSLILLSHHAWPSDTVEILRDLRANPRYSLIPVVVLCGTLNEESVRRCYELGANSVILKPSTSSEIQRKISTFFTYWFETAELPR